MSPQLLTGDISVGSVHPDVNPAAAHTPVDELAAAFWRAITALTRMDKLAKRRPRVSDRRPRGEADGAHAARLPWQARYAEATELMCAWFLRGRRVVSTWVLESGATNIALSTYQERAAVL